MSPSFAAAVQRIHTCQPLYCFWIVDKNTEIIEYLRAATFKVDSFLRVKQEPLFHRRPCRWLCSSCGRWLLQNKHCCPSLIHVSEQTNSLVNHTFLSGFRGWAANQTLAQKQAHKPRVKMNRVCGGFTTKAPPWVEGMKLLNVKQRQEGFDLHQSRCSVTRRKKQEITNQLAGLSRGEPVEKWLLHTDSGSLLGATERGTLWLTATLNSELSVGSDSI